MIKKEQIIELLEKYGNETDLFKAFISKDEFSDLADDIVKLFAIPAVMVELTCPRCGSTNTAPSDKENDCGCYDCGFVWQDN